MSSIYLTHPANLEAARKAIGWTGGRVATDDRLPVAEGGEPVVRTAVTAQPWVEPRLLDKWAGDLTHETPAPLHPTAEFFEAAGIRPHKVSDALAP
jgi:hypothetical protein